MRSMKEGRQLQRAGDSVGRADDYFGERAGNMAELSRQLSRNSRLSSFASRWRIQDRINYVYIAAAQSSRGVGTHNCVGQWLWNERWKLYSSPFLGNLGALYRYHFHSFLFKDMIASFVTNKEYIWMRKTRRRRRNIYLCFITSAFQTNLGHATRLGHTWAKI